jgi:mannose-1-phosphate guanylyltransferase
MSQTQERKLWGIVLAAGEGTRVRNFLAQLCGGRGIKQFCAVIGRRSMLEHTLARVERLIPRERILVVVSTEHREEVFAQLAHWPADNVIFQPRNRDTAPGILLPLAHISHREPFATVAIFPSDHFILEEDRFMASVRQAVVETHRFPRKLILLGMTPSGIDNGYGWIEPGEPAEGGETRSVLQFWEKPSPLQAQLLLRRGALWNTFVCVTQANTLWEDDPAGRSGPLRRFHAYSPRALQFPRAVRHGHGVSDDPFSQFLDRHLSTPGVQVARAPRARRRLERLGECRADLRLAGADGQT